jgi:hypothetical protein
MNHGATNGIMLAIAWAVLLVVSGLIFNDRDSEPAARQLPELIQPHTEREQLRITPYQNAEDAEEENSGGSWRRRRTAFA